ncbi:MAG: response regulator [Anaerolineales bacterium]
MAEEKSQILIVEDDLDLAEMLNSYFRVQGYEVLTAAWGEEAVRLSTESHPDLIVLDIRLPDIDGYEVCRQVRSNRMTANIPIIFLTEKRDRVDKLAGLELGVVDYITKPFDIQELRLRVRNALQRSRQSSLINPVTNAAEDSATDAFLEDLLDSGRKWSILTLRIGGLDGFREQYGFVASDDVLRAVALMMVNAVRELDGDEDFIGHFNGDDFVIITDAGRASAIQERIETRVQQSLAFFYPLQDRDRIDELPPDKHLRLMIGEVKHSDAEFTNLDSIKRAILSVREHTVE